MSEQRGHLHRLSVISAAQKRDQPRACVRAAPDGERQELLFSATAKQAVAGHRAGMGWII
jgi:hypothetical protein